MKAIRDWLDSLGGAGRFLPWLGLLMVSWWGVEHFGPPAEPVIKPEPGKVDYFSRNLRRMVMDENGNPKEYLVVDELVHYENDNHSELSNPNLTLYVSDGPPWVIQSESATLPNEDDLIYLHGDVLVTRDEDKNGRTLRIETTNARVRPKSNYAETDEDITVLSPPDLMTGTGAQVTFGDNLQYKVLSNVRRVHEVPSENP